MKMIWQRTLDCDPAPKYVRETAHFVTEEIAIVEHLQANHTPVSLWTAINHVARNLSPDADREDLRERRRKLLDVVARLTWESKIIRDRKARTIRLHKAFQETLQTGKFDFFRSTGDWQTTWRDHVQKEPTIPMWQTRRDLVLMERPVTPIYRGISLRKLRAVRANVACARTTRLSMAYGIPAIRKMSASGQIVVPIGLRKKYGLLPGTEVNFREIDGKIFFAQSAASRVAITGFVSAKGQITIPAPLYRKLCLYLGARCQFSEVADLIVLEKRF